MGFIPKKGGPGFLNFPKCVYLALKATFSAKTDKKFIIVPKGGSPIRKRFQKNNFISPSVQTSQEFNNYPCMKNTTIIEQLSVYEKYKK